MQDRAHDLPLGSHLDLLLGFALDLVNMFVATVAYPDIARELHASVTQLAWVGNAEHARASP